MPSIKSRTDCALPRERKRRAQRPPPVIRQFKKPRQKRPLNFLDDFPGELRNKIYELSLVAAEPINMLSFACPGSFQRPPQKLSLCPALLSTCQQIYEEAKGVLYGMNTFAITIRTRPSVLRSNGVVQDTSLDAHSETDPDVICLSDRPRFDTLKYYQIENLRIYLAPAAEVYDEDTEEYHERLLQDICATFLRSTENLTISTRKIEEVLDDDDIGDWKSILDEDFDRSSDVLDMGLALEEPCRVIVDSSIYVRDSAE